MKITTVGQLRQALSRFEDDDNIHICLHDDYGTYAIGADIDSYTGAGVKEGELLFFNNGGCRLDMTLTGRSEGLDSVPMRVKVVKREA